MLISFVAIASVVSFPGGSANDFAKSVAEATHQNVVVAQSIVAPVGAVDYDPTDLNAMARAFRTKTSLALAPGIRLILSDGLIPPTSIAPVPVDLPQPQWKKLDDVVHDGKVTLETTDKDRLDPASLEEVHFSKPLKVHWFFANTPVSAWVHDMPEREFLTYVAKSLGAMLVITPTEYRLDFDGAEIRKRAIARIDSWPKKWFDALNEDDFRSLKTRFSILGKGLEAVPAGNMNEAFRTPESSSKYAVARNSSVVASFGDALKTILQEDSDTGTAGLRTPVGFIHIPDQLDPNKAMELRLTARFNFSLFLYYTDTVGKPGVITFSFAN